MLKRDRAPEYCPRLTRYQRAEPVPLHRRQNADGDHHPTQQERPAPPALGLQLPVFKDIVLILKAAADVIGYGSAKCRRPWGWP